MKEEPDGECVVVDGFGILPLVGTVDQDALVSCWIGRSSKSWNSGGDRELSSSSSSSSIIVRIGESITGSMVDGRSRIVVRVSIEVLEVLDNIRCWWKVFVDGDIIVLVNESFIYNSCYDEGAVLSSLLFIIFFVNRGRSLGGCIIVLNDTGDGDYHFEVIVVVELE